MTSQDFDEKKARDAHYVWIKKQFPFLEDSLICEAGVDSYLEGARWQHQQDRAEKLQLEDRLEWHIEQGRKLFTRIEDQAVTIAKLTSALEGICNLSPARKTIQDAQEIAEAALKSEGM